MSACMMCESQAPEGELLCRTHLSISKRTDSDDWSEANRIWCAFFHRKVEIERVDDFDGLKDRLDGAAAIVGSDMPTEQPWEES